jgi:hypothetical protein
MFVDPAEPFQGEFKTSIISGANAYLVEIGQLVIYLTDKILIRECVSYTTLELGLVAIVIEQYGV